MNYISEISTIAIIAFVSLCVCYMFFYENISKKDPQKVSDSKYKDIYEIAKLIVDDFDPTGLKPLKPEDHQQAVTKVQDQAKIDGLQVTDDVAAGAVKKAVQDKKQESPKNQGFLVWYKNFIFLFLLWR